MEKMVYVRGQYRPRAATSSSLNVYLKKKKTLKMQ